MVTKALPKTTTIPPVWIPGSKVDGEVADEWLKSFNDPGVIAVVSEAIANNTDLRQAAAKVETARQAVVVVGAQLKPQVGAKAGASTARDKDQDKSFNSSEVGLQVSWELDIWGRLRAERAAAFASYEATALDYSFARQSLAATTAKSWYLAIETRQLVQLGEESVQLYTRLLELTNAKHAAGQVAALDVAEASARVNQAQSDLGQAQILYSEARRNLEVLVGRFPAAELEVSRSFAPLPPPVQAGLPASLLERRPDIVAAERQVLAAFRTEEAARLALRPDLTLTAAGGRRSDGLLDLLRLNPWAIQTALRLFQPIYEGGALRAEIKIANAQQEQAVANYGSVALRAFREVEIGLTNEELLNQRLRYANEALANRTETVRLATVKYQAGALSLLPVLQLQTEQLANQAEVIKLRNTQLANRINLHLALGGSFEQR